MYNKYQKSIAISIIASFVISGCHQATPKSIPAASIPKAPTQDLMKNGGPYPNTMPPEAYSQAVAAKQRAIQAQLDVAQKISENQQKQK